MEANLLQLELVEEALTCISSLMKAREFRSLTAATATGKKQETAATTFQVSTVGLKASPGKACGKFNCPDERSWRRVLLLPFSPRGGSYASLAKERLNEDGNMR